MVFNLLRLSIFCILITNLQAQDLSRKANNFLNTLSPELKSKPLFTLNDAEQYNMNYVPMVRKGPTFHDFSEKQKESAIELLKASLSQEGYRKTSEIMELENVLRVIENNRHIDNYQLGFAKTLRAKIEKAGFENFSFAWAGSLEPGRGHYYRIQGPMLLIEYDNTQNNANHVHAVERDLDNDFAEDILKEHYGQHH